MTGIEAMKAALESTKTMVPWYLGDFTDGDMLVRPVAGANHAAWHMGHLIVGDAFLVQDAIPDAKFDLPAGFREAHDTPSAQKDGPDGFLSKDEYLKLFEATRNATIAAVSKLTDADLDKPNPGTMKGWAPTLGVLFLSISNHTMMHAGQFTVIRRKLGKPVLF